MGSGYKKIHVCINDCILYRNEYKDLKACPTCGKPIWKADDKTGKSMRIFRQKCCGTFPSSHDLNDYINQRSQPKI